MLPHSSPQETQNIAERLPLLRRRAQLVKAVRAFFDGRGYLEVETPYLVPTPGEEVHLRCFRSIWEWPDGGQETRFLHTSPEFAMKRLVAAVKQPLYQLARVWRNGEKSNTHVPEFTMLEWYRPQASLFSLMDETEELLRSVLPPFLRVGGRYIDLKAPFERLTMQEAFQHYVGVDLLGTANDVVALAEQAKVSLREKETWEDLFFRLLLEKIEPNIGRDRPTFLTHWPSEQAALAQRDPMDSRVALRFELYAGGLELANAFEELTDAQEQRQRFEEDRHRRLELAPDQDWAIDEAFLRALPVMPPTSGIALGFDRLVMLATGVPRLDEILWLT